MKPGWKLKKLSKLKFMKSNKSSLVILAVGVILFILNLFSVDYGNLWSRENPGAGLRLLTNILLVIAMLVSLKHTSAKN